VIGATVCATRVVAGIDRYHFAAKDAIAAVLFAANWHFAQTGVNYFNQSLPLHPCSTTGRCQWRSSSTSYGRG